MAVVGAIANEFAVMAWSTRLLLLPLLFASVRPVLGQQQCYFAAGAKYRGPANLVPCNDNGPSACCLLGDSCLSGNTCYNYATGDLYQYGCTDESYEDPTCPYKCGLDPALSPWTALEYCDSDGVNETWVCHDPDSCGCHWGNFTTELLVLPIRGCDAMGSDAKVALYAPETLLPWVSLPSTLYGKTTYYQQTTISGTSTWISTAVVGYTPKSIGPWTTYSTAAPTSQVVLFPNKAASPSNLGYAHTLNATVPPSSASSIPLASATNTKTTKLPHTEATGSHSATSTSASPSSGLTTGAKIGIGVGIAGGVCLLAAIAIVLFFFRRRKSKDQIQSASPLPPKEEPPSWQGQPYPPGGSPYGYQYNQGYPFFGPPATVHEASYSPADEQAVLKATGSPPLEMQAEHDVPEMESRSPSDANVAK